MVCHAADQVKRLSVGCPADSTALLLWHNVESLTVFARV